MTLALQPIADPSAPLARRNPVAKLGAALLFSLPLVSTVDPLTPALAWLTAVVILGGNLLWYHPYELAYYNPLLAAWRKGAAGKVAAEQSKSVLAGLNVEITKAATAAKAKVADVAGAFATSENGGSPEPTNVTRICDWTWMCSNADIHANDAGYAAMAKAVLDAR